MNQKAILAVLVALVVVLAGMTIYFAVSRNTFAPSASQPVPSQSMAGKIPATTNQTATQNQATTTSNLNPKIKPLDDKWNLYTNEQLGFSIKIPKQIYMGITPESKGNCPEKEAVNVFEDGNSIDISGEYAYSAKLEKCVKTDSIKSNYASSYDAEGYDPDRWPIIVNKAENEQDILGFIKEISGGSCTKFTQTNDVQPGVSRIIINTDGKNCIMNFSYFIWYGYGKLVYLSTGQAERFLLSPFNDEPFAKNNFADEEMTRSFRIIEE